MLGYSAIRFRVEGDPIADQIDACCRRPSADSAVCRLPPYAEAMATGEAEINRCPPGR